MKVPDWAELTERATALGFERRLAPGYAGCPSRPRAGRSAAVADLAARRDGPGVRQLRANLRRVHRPPRRTRRWTRWCAPGMRSYARYWWRPSGCPAWTGEQCSPGWTRT